MQTYTHEAQVVDMAHAEHMHTGHPACKAPDCLLEMVNVCFSYKNHQVLNNLNLHVHEHELVALVGDNGAGKSTIAKLAMGELAPTSGTVELFCENPSHFRRWQHVGYVSQLTPGAVQGFPSSVYELVDGAQYTPLLSFEKRLSRAEKRSRTEAALAQVGMQDFGNRLLRELSGGQLQRVRLACALVGDPELLVLDEPTTGLDRSSRQELYQLIQAAHVDRNLAVLMVTHEADALAALSCRVLEIEGGAAHEHA